jgi:transposase
MSRREAAMRFGVAPSAAVKIVSCWRKTGSLEPRSQGGDRRSGRLKAFASAIIGWIRVEVDMTLAQIAERLAACHGDRFSQSAIGRRLERHDETYRKKLVRQRARASRRGLGAPHLV